MIFIAGFDPEYRMPVLESLFEKCPCIFASKRFQEVIPQFKEKMRPIVPIDNMIKEIGQLKGDGDILVLASGDPLFFGIGKRLLKNFKREELTFIPALTTLQKASARFRLPWDEIDCVSLHGKRTSGLGELVGKILEKNRFKVAVFTDNQMTPDAVARELLERGLTEARFLVAEDIGGKDENFLDLSIKEAAKRKFHPLNLLIILGNHDRGNRSFGQDTGLFRHEKGLITKAEVRPIILSKLALPGAKIMWDVGAGSGSISMEASLLAPGLEIYSVESRRERCAHILENKKRFTALNVHVVQASAPDCLKELPRPQRIFIGGGLGTKGLLEQCWKALEPGGVLVASIVLLENLEKGLSFANRKGLSPEVVQVEINRMEKLGQGNFLRPAAAIFILRICK